MQRPVYSSIVEKMDEVRQKTALETTRVHQAMAHQAPPLHPVYQELPEVLSENESCASARPAQPALPHELRELNERSTIEATHGSQTGTPDLAAPSIQAAVQGDVQQQQQVAIRYVPF